jgi:hypothetical protein
MIWTAIVMKRGKRVPGTILLWGHGAFFVFLWKGVRCVLFIAFLLAALWLSTRPKTAEAETRTAVEKSEK